METTLSTFLKELQIQRWDDHRYYHHNRVNQSLHLVSALCFVAAYVWLFIDPVVSALLAWLVSMTTRQAGHFFFEPHSYDEVNQATHAYKEDIWAASPLVVWVQPTVWGLFDAYTSFEAYVRTVAYVWLGIGAGGLVFRMLQLTAQQNLKTALVWGTKIITDPFHDIKLYYKAPLHLLRGEIMDPMTHVRHG